MNKLQLQGQAFGRLKVIEEAHRNPVMWKCLCDCGKTVFVTSGNLNSGRTSSCGCLLRETITRHGLYDSPEYHIWAGMLQRCNNPKAHNYEYYGGRGIKVCDRWSADFMSFYEDMGEKPFAGATIDRMEGNGNYEKENCQWISRAGQMQNTRVFKNNKLGIKGVHFETRRKVFIAKISVNRKTINLGSFHTAEEAAAARKNGEVTYWGQGI